jgi:hypothetical protein
VLLAYPLFRQLTEAASHAFKDGTAGISRVLHLVSRHTGIPVVVVAAAALVISFRMARRAARLAVEMGVALGLILVATKMGWIRW